jgi:Fe-S cluster biosynthesis and repair protein YggX
MKHSRIWTLKLLKELLSTQPWMNWWMNQFMKVTKNPLGMNSTQMKMSLHKVIVNLITKGRTDTE